MDAGQKRIATVQRAKEAMGKCSCWTEVLAYIREDINALSEMTGINPVEIGFSIIDDVIDGVAALSILHTWWRRKENVSLTIDDSNDDEDDLRMDEVELRKKLELLIEALEATPHIWAQIADWENPGSFDYPHLLRYGYVDGHEKYSGQDMYYLLLMDDFGLTWEPSRRAHTTPRYCYVDLNDIEAAAEQMLKVLEEYCIDRVDYPSRYMY